MVGRLITGVILPGQSDLRLGHGRGVEVRRRCKRTGEGSLAGDVAVGRVRTSPLR